MKQAPITRRPGPGARNPQAQLTDPERLSSRCAKAFGNPVRLHLLHLHFQREMSMREVQVHLALLMPTTLPTKNIGWHLRLLRAAKVVQSRREGHMVYFSACASAVSHLFTEISAYLRQPEPLEAEHASEGDGE